MISHKHKCIFVHIPGCAGTSIEHLLCGKDWRDIHKSTKHLYASEAKVIYRDYWDDYFKFSFVRNPWDRMISLLRFPRWSCLTLEDDKINVDAYLLKFPKLELSPEAVITKDFKYINNSIYLNILNENLDFVGRYEQLNKDFKIVCDNLEIKRQKLPLVNKSDRTHYSKYYDDKTRKLIENRYAEDIDFFGFTFKEIE